MKTLKDCESNDNTSDNFGAFTVNSDRAIEALEKMSFRKGERAFGVIQYCQQVVCVTVGDVSIDLTEIIKSNITLYSFGHTRTT